MDPILTALDKLRDELSKGLSAGTFRPAAVPADCHGHDAEGFRFTDPEQMKVDVHALPVNQAPDRILSLNLEDPDNRLLCAHLSQEAVNALARYLDAQRTDVPGNWLPVAGPPAVPYPRPRCDRARVGIGRCELNDGHLGTHRYCGDEWGSPTALATDAPVSDACPWGYRSTEGPARECDLTEIGHTTHSDGIMTWGEHSAHAVRLDTVSDACPARYSNADRDDEDQPCEKPVGHPLPHRAESEHAAYVWTDYNPRAYMADDETPEGS